MRKLMFVLAIAFFLSTSTALAFQINKCMEITSPGYYQLTADLSGLNGSNYCIKISASDSFWMVTGKT